MSDSRNNKKHNSIRVAALAGASVAASMAMQSTGSASMASFTGSYTPNFGLLPNPGATSVNAANPATINGTTYSLQSPIFDFANPIDGSTTAGSNSSSGGLGITGLSGFYGAAAANGSTGVTKLGASFGDQTTGGIISFGAASSNTRALGLLSTSTTGNSATGVELINNTGATVNTANVNFVYEIWRESTNAQTETATYTVDNAVSDTLLTSLAAATPLPGASTIATPTNAAKVAIDGTAAANQQDYSGTLTGLNWQPNGALWIDFADGNAAGSAGGVGVQTDAVAGVNSAAFISTATSAVPEPTAAALLGIAALGLAGRRNRARA